MELFMHLVSSKTRFNPCYIFSEIQKSYTKVCLNIILYYSEKLFHHNAIINKG